MKKNKNRRPRASVNKGPIVPDIIILVLIKLGFDKLTTPEKLLARLRLHIQMLTGNPNFPGPEPTLLMLQSAADELEQSIDDVNAGNKAQIPHRNNLVAQAEELIRNLSYYVQFESEGDAEKIQSAGFEVRKVPSASQLPVQVSNLRAKAMGGGKVKLRWNAVYNADIYVIEMMKDINNPADAQIDKSTKSSFVFENLTAGVLYYFKVYAINGVGDGNPSDIVEQRVL